jgi:formate C-acetyltransferase
MVDTHDVALMDRTATDDAWRGFAGERWKDAIDVRDFIQRNYTPYDGDASFLSGPTDRTRSVWAKLTEMFPEERRQGIYDVDVSTPSTITSHAPGYIDKDQEIIVGLQTDAPLKRAIMPNGGWRREVSDARHRLPGRGRPTTVSRAG